MKRNVDLNDISDGKLYTANDMVKTDCHDCIGCSDCCRGMGSSILLDPMDIWRLTSNLKTDFNSLLEKYVELGMGDGLILPNLKLAAEGEACSFLNAEGPPTSNKNPFELILIDNRPEPIMPHVIDG